MTLKPGEKSGNNGGIYVEVGPRGGIKDNFATIAETKPRHQRNALKATGCWQKEHLTVNVSQIIWRHDSWRRLITVRPVLYRLASIVQDAP
ncbi:cytoplasmic protein [Salmonella enterica]|uniref:Cytoplasmic protein n=1 Tax=Salmonella enterica TaxID=28901 RepID=A0A749T004_SALER|nr:cytoplasmic protein [Salmonella enterica]EAO0020692.1 cytoplasmic protein [Salmonella enterica subsp. enterica serovar Amsterdam var. 15+,34+]EBK5867438.1 cytoplasmic protein [Salmonella enterica subsp. enterica serovar Amsterdam]EBQ2215851.1 cytoplasmic protein [Salmonella enterica subsp. enterica]ECY5007393.1 cytoplasmic protein [Salmonella enterica subsp. enterica serovar Enteritidis]EDW7363789.1 cytoplasmic protein [Salmonella enterica subsp. enterica serovar Emek]